jgi:uncharacterized protein YgbK (DUF1537 family)
MLVLLKWLYEVTLTPQQAHKTGFFYSSGGRPSYCLMQLLGCKKIKLHGKVIPNVPSGHN